jgi:hypothetical protein
MNFTVANGTGERLWFVKHWYTPLPRQTKGIWKQARVETQLLSADKGVYSQLTGRVETGPEPSVWPLTPLAAMVVTEGGNDGINGRFLFDGKEVHRADTLKELIEAQHARLLKLVPNGAVFGARDYYGRLYLSRLDDTLYAQGSRFTRQGAGAGWTEWSGIFRNGKWVKLAEERLFGGGTYKPIVVLFSGLDVNTGRFLCFTRGYTGLQWLGMTAGAKSEILYRDKHSAAWSWSNRTDYPRMERHWILTDEARAHLANIESKRGDGDEESDVEYESDDFLSFRRWSGGKWDVVRGSFFGGNVHEDRSGCVWHLRVREAEVHFSDGRSQVIPLDACAIDYARLTVESTEAVWITTQQSLWRFVLTRDVKGNPLKWTPERRFSLQRFAFHITGPWICGRDVYYVAGDKLFHVTMDELLAGKGNTDR